MNFCGYLCLFIFNTLILGTISYSLPPCGGSDLALALEVCSFILINILFILSFTLISSVRTHGHIYIYKTTGARSTLRGRKIIFALPLSGKRMGDALRAAPTINRKTIISSIFRNTQCVNLRSFIQKRYYSFNGGNDFYEWFCGFTDG